MNGQETLEMEPLDKVIDEFGGKQGTLIPVLQRAQDIYGYLPPEVLSRISEKTGLPSARSTEWSPFMPSSISSAAGNASFGSAMEQPAMFGEPGELWMPLKGS